MNCVVIAILIALFGGSGDVLAQQVLPVVELTAGMHRIEAEVAATQDHRITGLMQRKQMPPQRGMLFVFPQEARQCMWMRNTYLPLSVAFLDGAGNIINIEDMQPHTEENHCATRESRFALEMNLGWFKSKGLVAGSRISGTEKLPAGR